MALSDYKLNNNTFQLEVDGGLYVTVRSYPTKNTVQLQSVGHVVGTVASELKIGDTMVWNWGGTSTIKKLLKETNCFLTFQTEAENMNGVLELYERRLKKTRLVARPTNELPQKIISL